MIKCMSLPTKNSDDPIYMIKFKSLTHAFDHLLYLIIIKIRVPASLTVPRPSDLHDQIHVVTYPQF